MRRLFTHGTLLTCDRESTVFHDASIAVENGIILGIGPAVPVEFSPDETVDCTGCIVMPGLINTHVHLGEHLFRGWMDETVFEGLFYSTLFRWEGCLTPEDVLAAGRAAAAEAVKMGVTTVADMYHHASAAAEAVSDIGLRACVGQKVLGFSLDRPPHYLDGAVDYRFDRASFEKQLAAAVEFAEHWSNAAEGRITTALCPHATNTLTAEMLGRVGEVAAETGLPIHMHLAQMESERATVRERDGMGCVKLIERCGLLEGRFLGAHGIYVANSEMGLLARPQASVVHNPIANAKDAGLVAPIPALQAAGVRLALGTDAFRMDLLESARFAAYINRTTMGSGTAFPAKQVLRWATANGAAALGIDHVTGTLEPGKAADLVILDAARPESVASGDPHVQVLNYGSPDLIRRVYVQGRLLCRDGELTTASEEELSRALRERQKAALTWKEGGCR